MEQTLNDAYKLIHNGAIALAKAERAGIRVDMKKLERNKKKLTRTIKKKTDEFKDTDFYRKWEKSRRGVVNINSDDQLSIFLYKTLGKKVDHKTKSGKGSTDKRALQSLNIPALEVLLKIRELQKLRDTYLASIERECVDGYIHPFYNLHRVVTYRSSSSDPNFQNMPMHDPYAAAIIRSCMHARPGNHLMEIDFGNLEVRIAACYHKDPTMIKYLKDPSTNMHTDTAKQIFFCDSLDLSNEGHKTLRMAAKNSFVFPQFYGDYYGNNAEGLSTWIQLPTNRSWKKESGIILPGEVSIAEHLRDNGIRSYKSFVSHIKEIEEYFWNERFPVYNSWRNKWWQQYQRTGYFDTLTGFRCTDIMGRNSAINYPVQGSAFHCLLYSFIEVDRALTFEKMNTRLVGQIHDSILADVPPSEVEDMLRLCQRIMTKQLPREWKWIIVPLEVEADLTPKGGSWYDKKSYRLAS